MAATRVGIVGAGGVAARHVQVLGGFDDVVLAGVADTVPERARELAAAAGAPAYPSLHAMLDAAGAGGTGDGAGLDAVWICVPPFAHGEPELTCVAAGLPFLVEKPLAAGLDVAEEVGAAVAAADLLTSTGYHWRYLDTVDEVRGLLADRPARLAVASWLDKVPPPAWWARRDGSGGQVVEQATHLLDLLRVLVGEVVEVSAVGAGWSRAEPTGAEVDEATAATLRFASGAVGTLAATVVLRHKHRAALELHADGIALALAEDELVVTDRGGTRHVPAAGVAPGSPYEGVPGLSGAKVALDRAFVDAVRAPHRGPVGGPDGSSGSGHVRVPYAEALRTHRLACALAESAASGAPVRPAVPTS